MVEAEHALGKGFVFSGMSIEKVLQKIGVQPDFEFTSKSGNAIINNNPKEGKKKGGIKAHTVIKADENVPLSYSF